PVRRLVPVLPVRHVLLPVVVDVERGHALGPELGVEDDLLPGDDRVGRDGGRGECDDGESGEKPHGKPPAEWGGKGIICAGVKEASHSTVTLFARFRGLSTSHPRSNAISYASSCSGIDVTIG